MVSQVGGAPLVKTVPVASLTGRYRGARRSDGLGRRTIPLEVALAVVMGDLNDVDAASDPVTDMGGSGD
ncbi:hypothetical protein AB0D14_14380 [Streptomyces sp. NPDC048484]|uniref:hypothetical protein n=1 Tax=Streptomyces sp. NPDC048484 TaxID=3155146 RepID=UPI0034154F17